MSDLGSEATSPSRAADFSARSSALSMANSSIARSLIMDALGIGLILLGLIAVRSLNSLPVNGLTITLGILAFAWGVLDLMGSVLRVPFEVPVFAVLLVVRGVPRLSLVLLGARKTGLGGLR